MEIGLALLFSSLLLTRGYYNDNFCPLVAL